MYHTTITSSTMQQQLKQEEPKPKQEISLGRKLWRSPEYKQQWKDTSLLHIKYKNKVAASRAQFLDQVEIRNRAHASRPISRSDRLANRNAVKAQIAEYDQLNNDLDDKFREICLSRVRCAPHAWLSNEQHHKLVLESIALANRFDCTCEGIISGIITT